MSTELQSRWLQRTETPQSIDDLCERFESEWRGGNTPCIGVFLKEVGAAEDSPSARDLLIALVGSDIEWRWRIVARESTRSADAFQAGEHPASDGLPNRPRLADYASRYEALRPAHELGADFLAHEYWVRHRWGDKPSHQEFLTEYGRGDAELRLALEECDAELARQASDIGADGTTPPRLDHDSAENDKPWLPASASAQQRQDTLETLLLDHYDWLREEVARNLRNAGIGDRTAEDVVQMVHARAFAIVEQFDLKDTLPLRSWLAALAAGVVDTLR